ncbi:hypothetical protein D3C84_946770 [compost metagenome]
MTDEIVTLSNVIVPTFEMPFGLVTTLRAEVAPAPIPVPPSILAVISRNGLAAIISKVEFEI